MPAPVGVVAGVRLSPLVPADPFTALKLLKYARPLTGASAMLNGFTLKGFSLEDGHSFGHICPIKRVCHPP